MAAAIVGLILWAITDEPNLAILFSLLADLLAGLPTVIKSYRHPRSESWLAYAISAVGFGIRTPENVGTVTQAAEAAVVGSALVERVKANLDAAGKARPGLAEDVLAFVASLAKGVAKRAA